MFIKAKKIIGNKAITQSGHSLGKIIDFEIDIGGQNIVKYYTSGGFLNLLKGPLVINANQVIEIKKDRIIVEDAVISEKLTDKKTTPDVEYVR
jgi:uncharacterized protein YrrD